MRSSNLSSGSPILGTLFAPANLPAPYPLGLPENQVSADSSLAPDLHSRPGFLLSRSVPLRSIGTSAALPSGRGTCLTALPTLFQIRTGVIPRGRDCT